jgi:hypothetical protein
MSLNSYDGLVSSVSDWLMRSDLTAVIPSFISLAEGQMNRSLRLRQMLKRSTTTLDEAYEGLPSDCLQVYRVAIDGVVLSPVTADQITTYTERYLGDATQWYAVIGDALQFAPAPAASATGSLELVYYGRLLALSASQQTNGMLDWAPDVYLYGTLLQASPYLQDDQRAIMWRALYTEAVEACNAADAAAEFPGPLVIRSSDF